MGSWVCKFFSACVTQTRLVKDQGGLTCDNRNHMINIVIISNKKYLVDVGFGSNGITHPIPLEDGHVFPCVHPVRGKLEYRSISQHSDPSQRLWVYLSQENETAPWKELYAFSDVEFFPADFEVLNLSTMTSPRSYFVQSVMCMKTILPEDEEERKNGPIGLLILHKDYVKRRIGAESEVVERLSTEADRINALQKYFGISLSPEEQKAIRGMASELKGRNDHL